MSYQFRSEIGDEVEHEIEDYNSLSLFEKHIIQCCKAPEWELRKWLKRVLKKAGFRIIEDDYVSERVRTIDKRYGSVHNMLAIRGEPKVALVAHSDVCRDHNIGSGRVRIKNWGGNWWEEEEDDEIEKEIAEKHIKVEPVVKRVIESEKLRRIIQDKNCNTQVGGDCRLGIAINSWIALNCLGLDLGLLFCTDEEIGLKSAKYCIMKELKNFDLLLETDRGNKTDQLVFKIGNQILCDYETSYRLLKIACDIGIPRSPVSGLATDIYALKSNGIAKNTANMSIGYYSSFSDNPNEYIDIQEAKDAMRFVAEVVKSYYLDDYI